MDARSKTGNLVNRSLPDPYDPQGHLNKLLDVRSLKSEFGETVKHTSPLYICREVNAIAPCSMSQFSVLCLTFCSRFCEWFTLVNC